MRLRLDRRGNLLTREDQIAKLALVVETAREVWVNAAAKKKCGPHPNRSWQFSPNRGISCVMLKDFDPTTIRSS